MATPKVKKKVKKKKRRVDPDGATRTRSPDPDPTPTDPGPAAQSIRIKEVTVTLGRVYNIGNYQSARYEVTAAATVPTGVKPTDTERTVRRWLQSRLTDFEKEWGVGDG